MLTGNELVKVLERAPILSIEEVAFRSIQQKYADAPLSAIGSQFGGRYNPPQTFEALYLADSEQTSLLEVRTRVETAAGILDVQGSPRIMLSINYKLNAILALCDKSIQRNLGTNLQELTGNWRPLNAQCEIAPTQELGTVAYNLQRFEGLKVPSSRNDLAYNLIVFHDRLLSESFLRIYDNSGTIIAELP
ncbi:RES family NAD+ phosphorylase [Argonema galeatum]|uniref:RES family NAD+ phosphorylase n=1 Tax=Argonema galeatum TaxID=2942762 RepID=UPI0020138E26|nr:RES family NAD+ phosphorylase [Argonema galeatum]MCL1465018.1 RES family NAD+ phosphorylase [Argonema galeatum A003/A1]